MKHAKQCLSILLVVLMLCTSVPLVFSATVDSGTCGENVTWTLDDTGTLTISGTGEMEDYSAPWCPWYEKRETINKIVINEGVTRVGDEAFRSCENLRSLFIPKSIRSIGSQAFFGCKDFDVYITDMKAWCQMDSHYDLGYTKLFWNNALVKNLILPNDTTTIADRAFSGYELLESVTIPNSVTSIGADAFWGTGLTSVTIPNGSIGESAFSYCSDLTNVFIGSGVTNIASSAFSGCAALSTISVNANNTIYASDTSGCLYNKEKTTLILYPCGNAKTSFSVPNGVVTIAAEAFKDCSSLENISIPASVNDIKCSFTSCSSLSTITVDANNPYYSSDAYGCLYNKNKTTLIQYPIGNPRTSFLIPSSVTNIGKYAFAESSFLERVAGEDNLTTIGDYAFRACSTLKSVPQLSNVTDIGYFAFSGCTLLEGDIRLDHIRRIKGYAFMNCNSINSFYFGKQLAYIDGFALMCNVDKWYIEDLNAWCNVKVQNLTGFYPGKQWRTHDLYVNGSLVTDLVIPEGPTEIKNYVFGECKSINCITVSNTVTHLGTLRGCENLTTVVLPQSIQTIVSNAFYNCPLSDIYFCGTESQWEDVSVVTTDGTILGTPDYDAKIRDATIHYNYNPNPTTSHSVTYNYSANGGTSATVSTATVAEGAAIDLTPTATKSGWTFVGWNTNANATAALSSLTMNTGDVTLYAIYKKTLTGTFIDYSGTSKTTRTASATIYNKATSGTVSAPAQNTYTGWSARGWTTGTAADASTTSSFTISANTTYYGTYQRTLTLSYNANGGSSTPSSQTGTQFANSYSISSTKNPSFTLANAINKSDSTFDGWAMGSTSGTKYAAGSSVSVSANTTMYATWKTTPVNIYNLGEETYSFPNYVDADSRGGHCFGMSSTSAMYYLKRIDISRVGGAGNNLYALPDNATVRKPICYYQGQQEHALDAMVAGGTYYRTFYRYGKGQYNISSDWNEVVNYVKSHNYDDKGTLQIGYRSDGLGGHAINFLRYAVENGQERIYAYDNNFPTTETYFYKDASGRIKQAPKATFKDGSIDCICLRDMSLFRTLAGDFSNAADDSTRKIYADRDAIHVGDILAYPIDGDIEMKERVLYYLPENETQVRITPNVDNAMFTYCDEEYHFGKISDETYGVLTLKSMDEQAGTDQARFSIVNAPSDTPTQPQPEPEQNRCPWCGGQHEGFFQSIVGFFHRILAAIFGAKY